MNRKIGQEQREIVSSGDDQTAVLMNSRIYGCLKKTHTVPNQSTYQQGVGRGL